MGKFGSKNGRRKSAKIKLAAPVEPPPPPQAQQQFINRELSLIQFNSRVLSMAADESLPLLERAKFLGIITSNVDEFVMKRVGGLKRRIAANISTASLDGLGPRQQMAAIRKTLLPLIEEQSRIYLQSIKPALHAEGIHLLQWQELKEDEIKVANQYFEQKVFPLLTPLSVDAGHPFPFLSNLSTSIGFSLAHPEHEEPLFARLKLSLQLPSWIPLPKQDESDVDRFVSLHEMVMQNAHLVFPRMQVLGSMLFRITRNVDLEVDDEDSDDLMDLIEEELRQRRLGQVVRLEHGPNPDPWILNFLLEELDVEPDDVYEVSGLLDYGELAPVLELDRPKLRFPRWSPVVPAGLTEEVTMFGVLRNHDLLVHHPYESFSATVERFVREAALDPKVLSIKMTVYRVGEVTPLIPYLIRAAEEGKQVVCLVELRARVDEKHNIHWAEEMEKSGVHVVYGIPGLKTHAKTLLVMRQDTDGVRAYAHCGTGNYHARTSNLYTDLGLFTTKPEYTNDLVHFFNYLTGRSLKDDYQKILVAPVTMEKRFLSLIANEIENKKAGLPAGIIGKMNALEDRHIIEALYQASQAGVQTDLIIRGVCCLRPGLPGLSDNIRVISIIGRLLEHSRLYYFRNGAEDPLDGLFFLGSADWMGRNLHRRVEVVVPVEDKPHREKCWQIIQVMLSDTHQSWELQNDGSYTRKAVVNGAVQAGTHETLMQMSTSASNLPAAL